MLTTEVGNAVGAQFIGAPPIYRPWERIAKPLADKSAPTGF
jgi:hypothetical protein